MQTYLDTGIKKHVIDEIILFEEKYHIHKVILFGSRARGEFFMKKYENFCASLENMKEILELHGFAEGATGSPKMILRTAYKAEID